MSVRPLKVNRTIAQNVQLPDCGGGGEGWRVDGGGGGGREGVNSIICNCSLIE